MNSSILIFLLTICLTITFAFVQVKLVPESPNSVIGQSPFWVKKLNSLFYVDTEKPSVLRFDYKTQKVYEAKIDDEQFVGFMVSVAGSVDEFVVGLSNRAEIIRWDGKSPNITKVRTVFEVATGTEQIFNDAKADCSGRLFTGTLRDLTCDSQPNVANASLFRYSKLDGVVELNHKVYISNGFAWDTKNNIFYYIGACQLNIKAYDYNPKNGEISNERIAVDLRVNGEYPGFLATGMTIDRDGFLWVTAYGAYKILKINPCTGKIVRKIPMPVRSVLACIFGGPNMDILYVTTGNNATDIRYGTDVIGNNPPSRFGGQLFEIRGLGSRGYYPNDAKI